MGYKFEQFVRTVDRNLQCPICHEVFKDPVSCKDGHTFCSDCITEWLKTKERCPLDNSVMDNKLVRNLTVSGIIDNLDVYCHPHDTYNTEPTAKRIKQENGTAEGVMMDMCYWNGKLQDLKNHQDICSFQQVQCPHAKCNEKMQRKNLDNHVKSCKYKTVVCKECLEEVVQHDLGQHQENDCPDAMIPCPNKCQTTEEITTVRRIDMTDHLSNACGKTPMSCPFTDQGCSEKVLRKDMDQHLQDKVSSHMLLLAKQNTLISNKNTLLTEKNTQLKNELNIFKIESTQLKEEMKKVKDNFKDQLSSVSIYVWTIDDFTSLSKKYPNGSFFRSPKFWLCGNWWYLTVYPNGANKQSTGFLSLFLNLNKDDSQISGDKNIVPNSKSSVSYKISVMSQKPGARDVFFKSTQVYTKATRAWGCYKVMKAACALSPSYLNANGSITVNCAILNQ